MAMALLLSGCAAGKISQTANQVPAIDGSSATVNGLGIRDARLATTSDLSYPVGSDIPVLFWLSNDKLEVETLTGLSSTSAASIELSAPLQVQGKSLVEVGLKTPVTATLKGLTEELHYGQTIPVTFTFANAGAVTIKLPITIPPERTEVRPTENILPEHGKDIWFGGGEHAEGEEGSDAGHAESTTGGVNETSVVDDSAASHG
ncbi:hypothetical protein D1871_20130 [Nakamurella silvestris]|nr:hypothetical protein D1871_20130 [Nakamurella silvestris]